MGMFFLNFDLCRVGPIQSTAGRNFHQFAVEILGDGCMWSGNQTFPIWVTLRALLPGTNSTNKAPARH
jgi:hypothetical protein